jgi:transposase-like protein
LRRRHFKPEQIIHMLREAEIKLAGGKTTGKVCRELGISEQSYYRWRKEYGGMQASQARKLKDLARENARLKKLVAEQALDKAILEEALSDGGNRISTYSKTWLSRCDGPAECRDSHDRRSVGGSPLSSCRHYRGGRGCDPR